VGTILALTSITVDNGVTVRGRALARNGNVTLNNDVFTTSACVASTVLIPPTMPPFTIAPSATPTIAPTAAPVATASAAPSGAAIATATPTGATPAPTTAGVQSLPSTSTADQLSPVLMLAIALAALGILMLLRRKVWQQK
jgi:LPXTG-motif cell wall-anchored protein